MTTGTTGMTGTTGALGQQGRGKIIYLQTLAIKKFHADGLFEFV